MTSRAAEKGIISPITGAHSLDDQHVQPIPSGITLVTSQIIMINNIDQVLYSTHDTEHPVHRGNNLLRKITEVLFNIF